MVGGSSRIPAFQELLRRYFGRDPQFSRNLDEDVARGAALIGALKTGTAAPHSPLAALPAPVDRSSHAIGVNALDDHGVMGNIVVLPANAPIPTVPPAERTFGRPRRRPGGDRRHRQRGGRDRPEVRRSARAAPQESSTARSPRAIRSR